MGKVRDTAEALWAGKETTTALQPVTTMLGLEELQPGLAFVSSFGNLTCLETSEGLALLDTGSFFTAHGNHGDIRAWTKSPARLAVYTHGHVDHAFGLRPFEAEKPPKLEVVAHEALVARFDRYQLTAGYNEAINARQFGMAKWPTNYRYPDTTYRDRLDMTVGGEQIELRHAKGETDDHTYMWLPQRRVLCTGDLFIWASPNCGNPQKVQRFPREWAQALRAMAALKADVLCPGHGPPIYGAERVEQALSETAELLETLVEQTLSAMNEGARLDQVLDRVRAPERLLARPYLRPVYDEPEFIVRNLWRLYGGWYDGNPANLKPARDAALAREVAALAGGAEALVARARDLASKGELALACHLVEMAALAAPDDDRVKTARAKVYEQRAEAETSLMAKGVYRAAAQGR